MLSTVHRHVLSRACLSSSSRSLSAIPSWATLDPSCKCSLSFLYSIKFDTYTISVTNTLLLALGTNPEPYAVSNIVNGSWCTTQTTMTIPNPMDKDAPPVCTIPDTQINELQPFIASLKSVPKSGVHNPLKDNERYLQFGEISRKVRDI